jgi:hypothetical protein
MRNYTITLINAAGCELSTEYYSLSEEEAEENSVYKALGEFKRNNTVYIGDTIRIKDA